MTCVSVLQAPPLCLANRGPHTTSIAHRAPAVCPSELPAPTALLVSGQGADRPFWAQHVRPAAKLHGRARCCQLPHDLCLCLAGTTSLSCKPRTPYDIHRSPGSCSVPFRASCTNCPAGEWPGCGQTILGTTR